MNKIVITILVWLLSLTFVYVLFYISDNNICSSVRSYFCNKQSLKYTNTNQDNFSSPNSNISHDDEPPSVQIINYKDWDIVDSDSIYIELIATDNITPQNKLIITWNWHHSLQIWINPIFVAVQDESGNIWIDYILVERP